MKRLRVDELAKEWDVDPRTILKRIERGELNAFKIGDRWRISVDQVQKYERENQKKRHLDASE